MTCISVWDKEMDHGNFWGVEALVVVGFPTLWSSWTTPMCTCARSPWGLIAVSTHRTEACQTSPLQDPTPACLQSQVPAHLCVFPSGVSGPLPKEQAGPKGKWPPLHPALDGLCSGQAYETPTPPALKEVQAPAEDRLSDKYHPMGPRREA